MVIGKQRLWVWTRLTLGMCLHWPFVNDQNETVWEWCVVDTDQTLATKSWHWQWIIQLALTMVDPNTDNGIEYSQSQSKSILCRRNSSGQDKVTRPIHRKRPLAIHRRMTCKHSRWRWSYVWPGSACFGEVPVGAEQHVATERITKKWNSCCHVRLFPRSSTIFTQGPVPSSPKVQYYLHPRSSTIFTQGPVPSSPKVQ